MNCRPGDFAWVVRAIYTPELLGRLVIVGRLLAGDELVSGFAFAPGDGPTWAIRSTSKGGMLPWRSLDGRLDMVPERAFLDADLRPIRPNEGEDESLSWAKPRVEESA
jgi:hypothetical protein